MEAGEEIIGVGLKRQRAPLSDSEDNVFSSSEVNDGQKRRRLEAAGQENRSPKPSTSGRSVELGTKPDTPIVSSVRSRVQQLTQRREGAPLAQRCLSDPGADSPSVIIHDKGFKEHLLSEDEFNQRMERFKAPILNAAPAPAPVDLCPRSRSTFVSDIHQKLQGSTTPSSKQASRIRQEREKELNQLQFQPISENAWLKRSSSDPSLSEQGWTPPGSSSHSWIPRSRMRVHWPPPKQPWDVDGAEMKDGSFTEVPSAGEKPPVNTAGERAPCESDGPAAAVALESSSEVQLQIEWKNQNTQSEEVVKEKDHKALSGNEDEQSGFQESETQTVLKLSFSEAQSVSQTSVFEDENVSGVEQTQLESEQRDEMKTHNVSKETEYSRSDVFSFGEDEQIDASSYAEEEIEPSTEEEPYSWRYPQHNVHKEGESVMAEGLEEDVCADEERLESSRVDKEKGGSDHSELQDGECCIGETAGSSELQEDEEARADEGSVKDQATLIRDQENMESSKDCSEEPAEGGDDTVRPDTEGCTNKDDACQQSNDIQATSIKEDDVDLGSNSTGPNSIVTQTEASPLADVSQPLRETQTEYMEVHIEDEAQAQAEVYADPVDMDTNDPGLSPTEVQASVCMLETDEVEQEAADERHGDGQTEETHRVEAGETLKKVTFILEPELINNSSLSETSISVDSRAETSISDTELSSHDETNTSEIIDRMFEEVLEYAGMMEEERGGDDDAEDRDSGIGACSGDKDKMDTESEKEKSEEEPEAKEECDESNGDELLTFPPSGILSPLSKSVEAVVTPLRLAASQESNPPSLLLTPEETTIPPVESAPLYSVDAYRTQRQNKLPTIQSVTPGVQRRAPEKSQPQQSVNMKEKIAALNEEAGKLQNVINQTLQALSCCTDEEHGRGSLEEAEAEKLLLVSCEKRSALLAEVTRLREARNLDPAEAAGEDKEYVSQHPCRGTVNITNIQLPLKVEFVCSSHSRAGRPSHYFFILIRYGPCNIVATPLATAADAKNGDTISFPTSVNLEDIRSCFEIDVEVYSLSHTSASTSSMDRTTTKSRVTPRKLLSTITRSNNSLTSAALPALNTRRSSNFCLVGSHKITLASLGHSKFPLDKMKLEGKIRRLLGDEFQEKVPFLSPLEGNIYLRLSSESHSNVQHQGFLTMFELISGYGVWHRRYFVLEGCNMCYWNHPNDKETKEAEGSISLSSSPSQCVRPVKRDSCARPFTFELVSNIAHQQADDSQEAMTKCWFSADTKQDRLDWMEKLSQALLDFHTWNRTSAAQTESQQSNTVSSGNLRESIL